MQPMNDSSQLTKMCVKNGVHISPGSTFLLLSHPSTRENGSLRPPRGEIEAEEDEEEEEEEDDDDETEEDLSFMTLMAMELRIER